MSSNLPSNLSNVFNRFVGMEVPVTEERVRFPSRGLQQPFIRTYALGDVSHETVAELSEAARSVGKSLRFIFPHMESYELVDPDRLNVVVDKDSTDDVWRIQDQFTLG
jgi:hypothetical protein